MTAIIEIIKAAGKDPFDGELVLRVENDGWMRLTIEAIGTGPKGLPALSVCHYGEQNGDLMRDPEMCFEVCRDVTGKVILDPYSWRNDWVGVENTSRFERGGNLYTRPRWYSEHKSFARMWSKNLRQQGFVKAAKLQAKAVTV